jgi:uncharacterized surface protein with fasciclin (FAS1) repeats
VFTFLNLGLVFMSNYFQKSLTFGLPSAIAATLGMAIASTGLFYSLSSHAQSGTPGTTTTPTASPTIAPGGSMTKPDPTTAPGGSMSKPDPTTAPGGSMSKPDPTTAPGGSMSKPNPTTAPGGSMSKPDPTATPGGSMDKPAKKSTGKTIVDVASKDSKFKILVKALKAADLVETLSGEGPYTVFAPTDAAFKKLGSAKLKSLLKPENQEQLKKILTYHVVAGKFTSKMLKSGPVPTVEGTNITVKVKGKNVMINKKTKVTQADIKASNGVIHVVDNVLSLPAN